MMWGHSATICINLTQFRDNLRWLGTFATFGGEGERLETHKKSLVAIWGMLCWICDQAERLRAVCWSFEWNSDDWRRVGVTLRRFGLFCVECIAKWDDSRRCVALQGDSGNLGRVGGKFWRFEWSLEQLRDRWRHSVMSKRQKFDILSWFVEVVASSGQLVLILRWFEALQWNRIEFRRVGCQLRWIGSIGTIYKNVK